MSVLRPEAREAGPPQLLDEVLPFLDHIDGHLQGRLLLLAEALDEVLHGLHGLGVHVIQQLLLQLLQPCPQLGEDRPVRPGPAPPPGQAPCGTGSDGLAGRETVAACPREVGGGEKYPKQSESQQKRHKKMQCATSAW